MSGPRDVPSAPLVLGLVGRIGAGKSTVARLFAARGAHVIDADRIAHDVLREDDVKAEDAARFGAGVVDADGGLDRRRLAALVFGTAPGSVAALAGLEAIVRPRVRRRIAADLERLRRADATAGRAVVVLDVPLLVQAGWADACDRLVVVECAEEVRRARLAARGWTEAEQEARETAWNRSYSPAALPPEKTLTVDASLDLAYTSRRVDEIWNGLTA
jgi:dephospho-CoA kinase